jgi:hypothetical protein
MDENLKKRFIDELKEKHDEALTRAAYWVGRYMGSDVGKDAIRDRAQELLHEAVWATLDGSRTWYADRVDIVSHLGSVVRSFVAHETRDASRFVALDHFVADEREADTDWPDFVPSASSSLAELGLDASPEDIVIAREEQEEMDARIRKVYQLAANDQQLVDVLNAVLDGNCMKPAEIARFTEMSIDDVYEAVRRLRRRLLRTSIGKEAMRLRAARVVVEAQA